MELLSVNIAVVRTEAWTGRLGRTGIDKRPATGQVKVLSDGVSGDVVCDTRHHGGVDRAVYAFSAEEAEWWAGQLDRVVPPGAFGENLTIRGFDPTEASIGERWTIGSAEFEVSAPRFPCRVFAGFWDVPDLLKRFTARGRPGAYLRVVEEGEVAAGDRVRRVHRPDHEVTAGVVFRALSGRSAAIADLMPIAHLLPTDLRGRVQRRTGQR